MDDLPTHISRRERGESPKLEGPATFWRYLHSRETICSDLEDETFTTFNIPIGERTYFSKYN